MCYQNFPTGILRTWVHIIRIEYENSNQRKKGHCSENRKSFSCIQWSVLARKLAEKTGALIQMLVCTGGKSKNWLLMKLEYP